jgi:peptidyl-dipeptidase Dcp
MKRRTFLKSSAATTILGGHAGLAPFAHAAAPPMAAEPLLAPWTGPHGGLPPFDRIDTTAFKPGLLHAMDLYRAEVAAIARNKARPDFDNTIAAFEDAGRPFDRATRMFYVFVSTMNDARMQKIEQEMAPLLAAFRDEIIQNGMLFRRIKAVYDARGSSRLTPEQQRLALVVYRRFARRGAALGPAAKSRLKEINQRLASLYTTFSQNLLAEEAQGTIVLEREEDLEGLPDSLRASAAAAAAARNMEGRWLLTNTRSSIEPFLTYSTRRDLREKAWRIWTMRGDNGDAHDNKAIIGEIVQLRGERARLLGFPTHAHWVTDDNMAKTPDAALELMLKVWKAAIARVREEVADMQEFANREGAAISIEPWDYRYYAEKVRKAKYDLDANEIKPYLQLDRIREAMFWAAGQVYGLTFAQVSDVPVYHPDMTVYEVRRGGRRVGLWYFDPYAREGKNSGAWMSEYRTQERFRESLTPIVSNNSNFVKGKPGQPVLISWDDAVTMFHEFGHALHGLNSNVRYRSLAGSAVKRDFVEFPSQLNEHWLPTPEVMNRFLLHYETGQPMPPALVAKIEKARRFNQGFETTEYLAAALYDMKIHLAPSEERVDPAKFERETMAAIGCPPEIVMRHRPTQFGHSFSGDGYSAGYYVYLWADTLTADAAEAFAATGSFYERELSRRLYASIMSVGNSIPPDEAFRRFRGRDVDADALMRKRGFPISPP